MMLSKQFYKSTTHLWAIILGIVHLDQVTTVIAHETYNSVPKQIASATTLIERQMQNGVFQVPTMQRQQENVTINYCHTSNSMDSENVHNKSNEGIDNSFSSSQNIHLNYSYNKVVESPITRKERSETIHENFHCRLYLAESTIPNAGLGVFTGVPYAATEKLPLAGDVIIPLSSMEEVSLISK
jgi:hypothetical protein